MASRTIGSASCAQVLGLMELEFLGNSVVGLPGMNGLSVEQRKRLTIGVELVANPCEPCVVIWTLLLQPFQTSP